MHAQSECGEPKRWRCEFKFDFKSITGLKQCTRGPKFGADCIPSRNVTEKGLRRVLKPKRTAVNTNPNYCASNKPIIKLVSFSLSPKTAEKQSNRAVFPNDRKFQSNPINRPPNDRKFQFNKNKTKRSVSSLRKGT